jgi:hypothetical protein
MSADPNSTTIDPRSVAEYAAEAEEVSDDIDLATAEAAGGWLILERIEYTKRGLIFLSKPIRSVSSIVRKVGPLIDQSKLDVKEGDKVIYGAGGITFKAKGPLGGSIVAVQPHNLITIDRSGRPKAEAAAP